MATIITLTQKKARSSKAQPLEIEHIITEVPADIADTHWKRIEVSTDIGGWTVGKAQLTLHLIHPPKVPVYYCNSLGPGLPSRLKHLCQAKQSLKTTHFPTITFLLHSVSLCSWTVRWDHHHGRSDVGLFWLKGWRSAAFGPYQLRITKTVISRIAFFLPLFLSNAPKLPGIPGLLLGPASRGGHANPWIQQKAEEPSGQTPPCTGTSGNDNGRLCNLLEDCVFFPHQKWMSSFFSSPTRWAEVYLQVNTLDALHHGWIFPCPFAQDLLRLSVVPKLVSVIKKPPTISSDGIDLCLLYPTSYSALMAS